MMELTLPYPSTLAPRSPGGRAAGAGAAAGRGGSPHVPDGPGGRDFLAVLASLVPDVAADAEAAGEAVVDALAGLAQLGEGDPGDLDVDAWQVATLLARFTGSAPATGAVVDEGAADGVVAAGVEGAAGAGAVAAAGAAVSAAGTDAAAAGAAAAGAAAAAAAAGAAGEGDGTSKGADASVRGHVRAGAPLPDAETPATGMRDAGADLSATEGEAAPLASASASVKDADAATGSAATGRDATLASGRSAARAVADGARVDPARADVARADVPGQAVAADAHGAAAEGQQTAARMTADRPGDGPQAGHGTSGAAAATSVDVDAVDRPTLATSAPNGPGALHAEAARIAAERAVTSSAASVQRVLDAVDLLESAPPPRMLTLELGEHRLRVAMEDGLVRLSLLGENHQDAEDGRQLLEDARAALEERGFELGTGREGGHDDGAGGGPGDLRAPFAGTNRNTTPAPRPADAGLRL